MSSFFTRDRFGKPQFIAGGILLLFLAQCAWLVSHGTAASEMDASELFRIEEGLRQWRGQSIAGTPSQKRLEVTVPVSPQIEENDGYDPDHSPLWYLLAAAPVLNWPGPWPVNAPPYWEWLTRTPYILFGVLLGASLWYVSRRLYGDAGGYIALTLYCFSPIILRQSTLWRSQPEMGAAWGTFGAIFTAIAVAHTLYAPREVVFWNWRRILLLGLSLALAIGCQFSLIILVPLALVLMLYVAPTRQLAAIVIWLVSCSVAALLLYAAYGFHPGIFWQGLRHASFFGMTWRALAMPRAYLATLASIVQSGPAVPVALFGALAAYLSWRRARYFGNTAPLLIAVLFVIMAVATPHYPGMGFQLMAIPFFFVFTAGIAADLVETPQGDFAVACISGLLAADALWNLMQLARVARVVKGM